MIHDSDLVDQEFEELAEEVWTLAEGGRDGVQDLLDAGARLGDVSASLRRFRDRGLAVVEDGRIALTEDGRALAERQVRRHRLAEVLFSTVLDVKDDLAVDRTACVIEHVLGAAVTDSVCAFLGHPKFCPHAKPIPPGPCCRSFVERIEPLVQPLLRLGVGASARIVYVVPRDADRLLKLSSLGVVPGATLRLQQKSPAVVVRIGETTVAVDPEIAAEIYVKLAARA